MWRMRLRLFYPCSVEITITINIKIGYEIRNGRECEVTEEKLEKLSVVLPAYNEDEMLPKAVRVLDGVLSEARIAYELIFVDDGSSDRTWQRIEEASAAYPNVKGVRFSRNFGKEAAIFAGLECAEGDCAAVMDCDLQHPPEVLVEMYRLWQEGYEVVEARKKSRGKELALHRACANAFYALMSKAVGFDMKGASDFKLLDRKALDALLRMPERNVFFRAMSSWIGFRCVTVEFDVREREAGASKWKVRHLISYAIRNIAGYSSAPLQTVTAAGIVTLVLAVILGVQTLVRYFRGASVEGFTTVILLMLMIGSVIMLSLGVIGYYIAHIYEEIKGRPRYIISDVRSREKEAHGQSQQPGNMENEKK